jgi:hypothetical protein
MSDDYILAELGRIAQTGGADPPILPGCRAWILWAELYGGNGRKDPGTVAISNSYLDSPNTVRARSWAKLNCGYILHRSGWLGPAGSGWMAGRMIRGILPGFRNGRLMGRSRQQAAQRLVSLRVQLCLLRRKRGGCWLRTRN